VAEKSAAARLAIDVVVKDKMSHAFADLQAAVDAYAATLAETMSVPLPAGLPAAIDWAEAMAPNCKSIYVMKALSEDPCPPPPTNPYPALKKLGTMSEIDAILKLPDLLPGPYPDKSIGHAEPGWCPAGTGTYLSRSQLVTELALYDFGPTGLYHLFPTPGAKWAERCGACGNRAEVTMLGYWGAMRRADIEAVEVRMTVTMAPHEVDQDEG
jgi:hypothetical protein